MGVGLADVTVELSCGQSQSIITKETLNKPTSDLTYRKENNRVHMLNNG